MAAPIFILLPLAILFTTAASQGQKNISLADTLTPTSKSSWLSPSGLFAFGFYQRGDDYYVGVFLPGTSNKTAVWTYGRDNPPLPSNSTLRFDSSGRLVLRSAQAQDAYVATPIGTTASASMLDSGNFVLYNSSQGVVWKSFDTPTDTILGGQTLSASQELHSSASISDPSTGLFLAIMQLNGVLALYPDGTPFTAEYGYWDSGTPDNGDNVTLRLDDDGFLYLSKPPGIYLYNFTSQGLSTEDMIYLARIDPDGLFRLYSYNITRKDDWSVQMDVPTDRCSPKGICGLNGFCTNIDQDYACPCLPGFASVKDGNGTAGCERNFTAESCKNPTASYDMQSVSNTIWEDATYSALTSLTQDECVEACRQDCNCEAVAYNSSQSCNKQKLPLRFGRRLVSGNSNSLLYVKVGNAGSGEDGRNGFEQKYTRRDILIAVASSIAFAIVMLAVSGLIVHKNRVWVYEMLPKEGFLRTIEDVAPTAYTFEDLKKVTGNFSEEIGRGAFGTVYKGTLMKDLDSSKAVAVKKLEKISSDGESEFQAEVKTIGKTHHRNLVRLLGYCHDKENRLLVYEYMSNGSLADVLFKAENQASWDVKMGIARNVARGLLYLHEECETQIIHCDIKPQNILIDDNMQAKISDFGLSKLLKPDQTNTTTGIRGTRGYVAPEWHKKLPVTVKADIYSFGVVLLEIIFDRKSVDWSLPEEEAVLEDLVYHCFQAGELDKLVDYQSIDKKQLERMVKVALWCILEEPSLRPSMRKVLLMLEGTVDVPIPPCPTSFLSVI
ncbi:G-type lectin S-receptor-like serine/threonine-protein kinase LECRK1 [Syzygium oleosum]|uniref:G-type lectin S-receptor-like serine/threonine-protein kinase LECRK1 n=1 Tax=Syzygium oleosum TaxID=219896 RepID=UPI0024B8AEFE|nr:G-type lectin S-receptor-like serine/threonine-protein kinase LECRK1 [Syzygium oleosum]